MNLINQDFANNIPKTFMTENVSLFLYSLLKSTRPHSIIEIGAGYSTLFLSEAIRDIKKEDISHISNDKLIENYKSYCGDNYDPFFVVIDRCQQQKYENAHFVNMDAKEYLNKTDHSFDLVWLDFGPTSTKEYHYYFDTFLERLNPGGFIVIHSTATNCIARIFLTELKAEIKQRNIELLTILEPHKKEQNSFTVIKKEIDYPIYTFYP